MTEYTICRADELKPGSRRMVILAGREVGLYNVDGRLYAIKNVCPHRGAPLCEGAVGGTMVAAPPGTYEFESDAPVLRCPWHRWEFDLRTGRSYADPRRYRVKVYPVRVSDGAIVIEI